MYSKILQKIELINKLLDNFGCVEDPEKPEEDTPYDQLDEALQNFVPYISTYFIKPIVEPGEEVVLDFFIRDYHGTGILNEEVDNCKYKAIINIEGKDEIILRNLESGNHSVSLGTFDECVEQKFSLLVIDNFGRHSHELFNYFLVRYEPEVKEYIMTPDDLVKYNIKNDDNVDHVNDTRLGLQQLLDDTQAEGFNRMKLLDGVYRINHEGCIYIPSMFTLDMNGAKVKLHEFTGDSALMFELNNTFDSHVVNGVIEGDYYKHDYINSPNNSEWVNGISIGGGAKYSSFENLLVKDITGYGGENGIADSRCGAMGYTYIYPKSVTGFALRDIDRTTGEELESIYRATSDFIATSGHEDIGYLTVSIYLGYQGNPCGTWNLICHFYDENKVFIKSVDAYQYRRVRVPANAKFLRVTILNAVCPTSLRMQLFRIPTHCAFKNIKFENCRCVGLAQSAMNNMLVEDCEFVNCGQSSARCAYDAEDGWDMMQDVTFRRLNFHDNPNNEFLTCAGHNFMVEDMMQGDIYIWERTKDFVLRNSNCGNLNLGYNADIVRHGVYRIDNVKCIGGNINGNTATNIEIETSLQGNISDSEMNSIPNNFNSFLTKRCKFNIGNIFTCYLCAETVYQDCDFIPVEGFEERYNISFNNTADNKGPTFINCHFKGKSNLTDHNKFSAACFEDCIFDDVTINANVIGYEGSKIVFKNCKLNSTGDQQLIRCSPFNYTVGNNLHIIFENCEINGENFKNFIYAYAKPSVMKVELINCEVNTPNITSVFEAYRGYLENIKDVTIVFDKTEMPCYNVASGLENYNIKIEEID